MLKRTVLRGHEGSWVSFGPSLVGRSLEHLKIRSRTGCTVLAITTAGGATMPNADPHQVIPEDSFLTVIGTREQIREFKRVFG